MNTQITEHHTYIKLMDSLGVRRSDVVAHDIGGGVAHIIKVR